MKPPYVLSPEDPTPTRLPPPAEALVSASLEDFAGQARAVVEALYHDQSLWYVTENAPDGNLARRLQVSAFGTWPYGQLTFIPDVSLSENGTMWILPQIPQDLIGQLPLSGLVANAEQEPRLRIVDAAWTAWKSLSRVQRSDLTRIVRPHSQA